MLKQIVIDTSVSLTRIGVLEEGKLVHLYIEDHEEETLQNCVLQGQVQQVVKNLKGAFIDFGKDKNGLLHFKNVPACYENKLQPGMRVPIQIQKENTGEKGNRLTSLVSIPGYYLVALPFEPGIQISKKIKSNERREQLRTILETVATDELGFIVRTNGKEASDEEILKEATYLRDKTMQFHKVKGNVQKGTVLIEAEPIFFEVIKEHIQAIDEVVFLCNNLEIQEALQQKIEIFLPRLSVTYRFYPCYENLFRLMSIEKDFLETLKRKVWLKNGGNIVIDYAEAMTVIDVNSAKAIIGKQAASAIRVLNKLAIEESIYQIIRRNLSGIILIDLVDFKSKEDRLSVYEWARQFISGLDGSRSKVYPPTELDLLQIARTKKYLPIHQKLLEKENEYTCQYTIPQVSFNYFRLENELKQIVATTEMKQVYIYCSKSFYECLSKHTFINKLQMTYGIHIQLYQNENQKQTDFDIRFHKQ
ncbi:MAG: ribonuclease E/G [Niameybacter sp.]|uniref:ribonuclease E/G n=1 Tax=Niameybacter sp. TaxID=2033640 RepID=UPI002FC81694